MISVIIFNHYLLRQRLSLNVELPDWASMASHLVPLISCLHLPRSRIIGSSQCLLNFYVFAVDLNSDPHIQCVAKDNLEFILLPLPTKCCNHTWLDMTYHLSYILFRSEILSTFDFLAPGIAPQQ